MGPLESRFIINKVLNHLEAEYSIVNLVAFMKFSRISHLKQIANRAHFTRNEPPNFNVKTSLFRKFFSPFDCDRME